MTRWADGRKRAAQEREHDFDEDQRWALTVACVEPRCEAPAGELCRNVKDGGALGRQPAHRSRVVEGWRNAPPAAERYRDV